MRTAGTCLILALPLLLLLSAPAAEQQQSKLEDGYTSLFNGKDLTGWVYPGAKGKSMDGLTETPDKRIEVKDGIIIVNEKDKDGKGGIKDLFTAKEYNKDFNVRLEFRAAPKADSGLYLRSSGAQLQVRDYPTVGPYNKVKFNPGDWNFLDVTVTGPVYSATVNGKAVSDKEVLDLTVKNGKPTAKLDGKEVADLNAIQVGVGAAALCKCNGEVIEKAMKCPLKGGIGLQAETGKFEFRNVRVKELPSAETK
jgi:hypothetical protein